MDESAIQLIQDTAVEAQKANRLETDTPAVLVGGSILSLERLQHVRSRFRGTYSTTSMQDFMAYVVARAYGQGFINTEKMSASVIFNLTIGNAGQPQEPGHGDHIARLTLDRSAAFEALVNACGTIHSQKELSEFIEDWPDNLSADYIEPAAASDPTNLTRAITAVRNVKIKAVGESKHVESDFGRSRSSLEDIEASSEHTLPAGFRFTGVPFEGLQSITTYVRLYVLTDAEKPRFKLRIRSYEALVESIGQDFKSQLLAGIGDNATMLLGIFELGA